MDLNTSVERLPGVGPTRAKQLAKLGIRDVDSLLMHFPRAYQNRGKVRLLSEADETIASSFILTVLSPPKLTVLAKRRTLLRFTAADESGKAHIAFFNAPYYRDTFAVGDTFRFWGKPKKTGDLPEFVSPAFDRVFSGEKLKSIYPVYPLTAGLSNKALSSLIDRTLDSSLSTISETLPEETMGKEACCIRGWSAGFSLP